MLFDTVGRSAPDPSCSSAASPACGRPRARPAANVATSAGTHTREFPRTARRSGASAPRSLPSRRSADSRNDDRLIDASSAARSIAVGSPLLKRIQPPLTIRGCDTGTASRSAVSVACIRQLWATAVTVLHKHVPGIGQGDGLSVGLARQLGVRVGDASMLRFCPRQFCSTLRLGVLPGTRCQAAQAAARRQRHPAWAKRLVAGPDPDQRAVYGKWSLDISASTRAA